MEIEFKNANLEVEFFKGCDGKSYGRNGIYGCNQSHFWIYQDILEKGYKNAIIFEDDVKLCPEFKKLIDEFEEPEERWDVLYLARLGPIVLDKPGKSFTLAKCLSTAAYIISHEGCKKLAYFNPDDLNYESDLLMTELPLRTYISNNSSLAIPEPPYTGELGFRITSPFIFYMLKYIDTKFGALIAFFILTILVKFLLRKWMKI